LARYHHLALAELVINLTGAGILLRAPALYSRAPAYYYGRRHVITAIRTVPALAVNAAGCRIDRRGGNRITGTWQPAGAVARTSGSIWDPKKHAWEDTG
jgi:hypothetical protein